MPQYHVYIDWTTEEHPRPYYVGKGVAERVGLPYRGEKHERIRQTLGFDRRVVLITDDETRAFDKERELISILRTMETFGCNTADGSVGGRISPNARRGVHLKLDSDVHLALKTYATANGSSMQEVLENYAKSLIKRRA